MCANSLRTASSAGTAPGGAEGRSSGARTDDAALTCSDRQGAATRDTAARIASDGAAPRGAASRERAGARSAGGKATAQGSESAAARAAAREAATRARRRVAIVQRRGGSAEQRGRGRTDLEALPVQGSVLAALSVQIAEIQHQFAGNGLKFCTLRAVPRAKLLTAAGSVR